MSLSRRHFLEFTAGGLGTAAAMTLLGEEARAGRLVGASFPNHEPKARRAIHICLMGGLSQVDSFDYKPALARFHEKAPPDSVKPDTFFGSAGLMRANEWEFRQHGTSGLWVSDLFPHLAGVADELTVIRSMHSESANHTPASFLQNTGFQMNGFPSLGSWLSYGLGNESDSLPTFIVLPDARSLPNNGASNWSSGFLPAQHQGVLFRSGAQPVRNLFPPGGETIGGEGESRLFLETPEPEARCRAAGGRSPRRPACRPTRSRPACRFPCRRWSISRGSPGTSPRCTDSTTRAPPIAAGVVFSPGGFSNAESDSSSSSRAGRSAGLPGMDGTGHENNRVNHTREARLIDQPVAALLKDLRQRGLLEDTLVLFTSEFGRTPFTQAPAGKLGLGRDHNPEGFTVWMAGAGLKGGQAYGATDEVGWKAVENPVFVARFPRHRPPPPGNRSRAPDLLPQRDRAAPDKRARRGRERSSGLDLEWVAGHREGQASNGQFLVRTAPPARSGHSFGASRRAR